MCGLVGIVKIGSNANFLMHSRAFETLLRLDWVRGSHSTGILQVLDSSPVPSLFKELDGPENVLPYWKAQWKPAFTPALLMGHNRYATQGAITADNAHPFKHGAVSTAHNGTLRSRRGLLGEEKNFPVDSDQLAYTMSLKGFEETVKELDGAYALTSYDEASEVFSIARNNSRTLYYVEYLGNFIYASSKWILEGMIEALSIKSVITIKDVPVHTVLSFCTKTGVRLADKTYEPKAYPLQITHQNYNWGGYGGGATGYDDYTDYDPFELRPKTELTFLARVNRGLLSGIISRDNGWEMTHAVSSRVPIDCKIKEGYIKFNVYIALTQCDVETRKHIYPNSNTVQQIKKAEYTALRSKNKVVSIKSNYKLHKATAQEVAENHYSCCSCGSSAVDRNAITVRENGQMVSSGLINLVFCGTVCAQEYMKWVV